MRVDGISSILRLGLLFGLNIVSVSSQGLRKSVLAPDKPRQLLPYYNSAFDTNLLPSTPTTSIKPWERHHFPKSCVTEANRVGCLSIELRAYTVTYSDCSQPWILCHCAGAGSMRSRAPLSLTRQIELFGKIPVKARSWVRNFHSLPEFKNVGGYAAGGDIAATSDFQEGFVTMLHELIHVLDRGWSETASQWRNAVAEDSCVLTEYANTNLVENFAEIASLVLLEIVDAEGYERLKGELGGLDCLKRQLQVVKDRLRTYLVPGGQCPPRHDPEGKSIWTAAKPFNVWLHDFRQRIPNLAFGNAKADGAEEEEEEPVIIWD